MFHVEPRSPGLAPRHRSTHALRTSVVCMVAGILSLLLTQGWMSQRLIGATLLLGAGLASPWLLRRVNRTASLWESQPPPESPPVPPSPPPGRGPRTPAAAAARPGAALATRAVSAPTRHPARRVARRQ